METAAPGVFSRSSRAAVRIRVCVAGSPLDILSSIVLATSAVGHCGNTNLHDIGAHVGTSGEGREIQGSPAGSAVENLRFHDKRIADLEAQLALPE
jgi:hypothetical protein